MRGDIDGNGKITQNDRKQISEHLGGTITLTGADSWCAKVAGNNEISVSDLVQLMQYLEGKTNNLTGTPTFADYYNNWTYHKVDDLTGYWTAEIAINGLKVTSDAIVNISNDEGIFYKSELSDGAIRFYATRPPIAEVSATITFKPGTGVITTSYESAKFHAATHSKDGADPITPTAIGAVGYDAAQSLTDGQKTQARSNIGAGNASDITSLQVAVAKKPDALLNYTILHVAKTGSDETGNGSSAAPYLTIQKALDSLPKLLMERAEIHIHAGNYEEDVTIASFTGKEMLIIRAADDEAVSIRSIYAVSCRMRSLRLTGFTLTGEAPIGAANKWGCALYTDECTTVEISNLTCTRTLAAQIRGAFTFGLTYIVRMTDVVLSNQPVAIESMESTIYLTTTVTGENNTVAIRSGTPWSGHGGFVQKGGSALAGEEQKMYGGQIW